MTDHKPVTRQRLLGTIIPGALGAESLRGFETGERKNYRPSANSVATNTHKPK